MDLGGLDGCRVGIHRGFELFHQGALLVDRLACDGFARQQVLIPLQIELGDLQVGAVAAFDGPGLVLGSFDGAVVDGGQELAPLNTLSFVDEDLCQDPADLGLQDDVVEGLDVADGGDQ